MLRRRERIVSHLLSSSFTSTSAISPLRRLLSAAAAASSNSPIQGFAVEEYLVDTCGLTRPQALKASTKLSHLKSPVNPNAVLAFLAGLGLSSADAAAVVAKDPLFLCAGVERTLVPVVDGLAGLGLSRPEVARLPPLIRGGFRRRSVVAGLGLSRSEIARLVSLAGGGFRSRSIVSRLHYYYLPLFGSSHNFFRLLTRESYLLYCDPEKLLTRESYLLYCDPEKVVKPNVVFLGECGIGGCDIAKLCVSVPRMLTTNPERVQAMVACAERLGVPRGSGMSRTALHAVAFESKEKIVAKVDYLKNTFRWSDAEVSIAVRKYLVVLRRSKESLKCRSEFFSEGGLEPAYIAHRPALPSYSLEGRNRPRYYVIKFLKANGLLCQNRDYYSIVMLSEKVFVEKFICPHKEAAPHLAEDYATACKGEVSTNFRFI